MAEPSRSNNSIYEFGYPSNEGSSTGAPNNDLHHSIIAYAYPSSIEIVTSPSGAYTNMVSNPSSYSYSRYGNDHPNQEIGWDQGEFSPKENGDRPFMIRWKSGKKVDQRLLALLETFFEEIYVKRRDFFMQIFPNLCDEFADIYNKIGAMLWNNNQVKHQTMQRSLSFGSPRTNKQQIEELFELRLQKFRVKTPSFIIAKPDGQGGQISGPINPTGGSNNSQ